MGDADLLKQCLAVGFSTRNLQSTGKRGFRDGTDTVTTHGHCVLETDLAQWTDSVFKIEYTAKCKSYKQAF